MPLAPGEVNYEHLTIGQPAGWTQVAAPDRAVIVENPRSRGSRAVRMMVLAGDSFAGGTRSEGTRTLSPGEGHGTDGWYAFNVYAPDGSDPWGRGDPAYESGGQWGIAFQLHHPQSTGSPPFALCLDRGWSRTAPHTMYLDVRGGGSYADAIGSNGKTRTLLTLHNPLPVGRWVRIIMHVGWRHDATGWVKAWTRVDGVDADFVLRVDRAGIKTTYTDMLNGPPYWKFGGYFSINDTSVAKRVLYNQGFRRAGDYADAAAWCLGTGAPPPDDPPPPAVIPLPPDENRFGTVTGGTVMAAGSPDRIRGSVYNLSTPATVPMLKAYLDGQGPAATGSGLVKGVIYTRTGGRVGETEIVSIPAGQAGAWVTLPFAVAPTLPPGDYRLALATGGADCIRYAAGAESNGALEWGFVTWPVTPATWSGTPDTGKRVAVYGVTLVPAGANLEAAVAAGVRLGARLSGSQGVVVPLSDVVLRTPDIAYRADIAQALALLDGLGFVCSIAPRPFRLSTGEPLTRTPGGAYVTTRTSN